MYNLTRKTKKKKNAFTRLQTRSTEVCQARHARKSDNSVVTHQYTSMPLHTRASLLRSEKVLPPVCRCMPSSQRYAVLRAREATLITPLLNAENKCGELNLSNFYDICERACTDTSTHPPPFKGVVSACLLNYRAFRE